MELDYGGVEAYDEVHDEPDEWFQRSDFWLNKVRENATVRKRRERRKDPLILVGFGLYMHVEAETLVIRDGATHFPSKSAEHRFFKGSFDIPPRIVVVDGKGSITLDALEWLAEQGVPLVRVRWDGSFSSIATAGGQAASPEKIFWQQRTREDNAARLAFAIDLIRRKISATLETVEHHIPESKWQARSRENIAAALERAETSPPETIGDVLGLEGGVASNYFQAWRGIDLKWKAPKRHPIPDDWRVYISRSALHTAQRMRNRHATHPVNAMLNYAYGILLSQKQIEAIAEGYDPTLGIVHDTRRKDRGRTPAFALDLMEPDRPVVDRAVLNLLRAETFSGADFDLQSNGVCRLNPQLARRLVADLQTSA